MKYKITNIKIPLKGIPDLFKEFKFSEGTTHYSYKLVTHEDGIKFVFSCTIWIMDAKVDVFNEYCTAYTEEGEVPVDLPDGVDLENYLQKVYERVL